MTTITWPPYNEDMTSSSAGFFPMIFVALGIALITATAVYNIGKNKDAVDEIRSVMLLGLVFIELTGMLIFAAILILK